MFSSSSIPAFSLLLFVQFCLFLTNVIATHHQHHFTSNFTDKITILPGQPKVSFKQFAGYVTVDHKKHKSLFYYFVEAQVDPSSKPLVLWLNGGLLIFPTFFFFT